MKKNEEKKKKVKGEKTEKKNGDGTIADFVSGILQSSLIPLPRSSTSESRRRGKEGWKMLVIENFPAATRSTAPSLAVGGAR